MKGWLRTRVFELAEREALSDRALARRMGLAPSTVGRVRRGEIGIGPRFLSGACHAFPGFPLDYLFPTGALPARDKGRSA